MAANSSHNSPAAQPCPPLGLGDEIATLRNVMKLVEEHAQKGDDLDDLVKILNTLGQASTRLCTLLKTDRQLSNQSSSVAKALNDALAEVIREMDPGPAKPSRRRGRA